MNTEKQVEKMLMEMFPRLSKKDAKYLAETGDDISVLVTRVLDDNIDTPTIPISSITCSPPRVQKIDISYNYPEVFQTRFDNIQECVEKIREEAQRLHEEAFSCGRNAVGCRIKPARGHYGIESDILRERAGVLNRNAAMLLMRRSLENGGAIDLHGLYVKEALLFLEDLVRSNRPREMVLVTGRKYNSSKLRPAVEKWLMEQGFSVFSEGPSLRAIKKSVIR
ncbi:hypothetical protein PAEPH01_0356 [Pancytospora epiphaga]|nr:hypothetical protein PAEPH01_0356 [Pancytospora epiphaga]